MKKILAFTLTLLFVLTAAASFSAAELPKDSKDLSVIYTNNCDGITVPVTEGKASGSLPDGTGFAAENLPEKTETVRVYPVQADEKDVQKWVEDNLAKEYDAAVTYYVACTDANGKAISNKGVKVTVDAPDTDAAVTVYAIDETGKATALTAAEKDGKITFTATGAQLYAFCIAAKNPSTSDTNFEIFAVLFSAATFAAVLLLAKRKRTV